MTTPGTAKERTALLLRDPDIATWIKDRARPGTGITQLEHLRIFLERTNLDSAALIQLSKENERKLRNVVLDFVREEQARGLRAKYVGNIWWSVRSLLRSVGSAPNWNPSVQETEADEEAMSRIVPTHQQVRQIAGAVKSARDRMVVLILASSGIRIGTFATQNGSADGLRLKNLVDLRLDPEPHFEKYPPILRIPPFLSKGKSGYYTGISSDAAEATVTYLKERQRRGERLSEETPLVVPDHRGTRVSRKSKDGQSFIVRKSLASRIQIAMDTVSPKGVRWTPHTLRAWVSTKLEAAEDRGLVSRTRREYFLGHALGSVDSAYNLGRALSADKIEELRASYAKCLPSLSSAGEQSTSVTEQCQALLLAAEFDEESIASLGPLSFDLVISELRKKQEAIDKATEPSSTDSARQKVVSVHAVEAWIAKGWRYLGPLNGTKSVIEAPEGASR